MATLLYITPSSVNKRLSKQQRKIPLLSIPFIIKESIWKEVNAKIGWIGDRRN
jgi:hypothetical protein